MVSQAFLGGRYKRIPITEAVTLTPLSGSPVTGLTAERRPIDRRSPFHGLTSAETESEEFVLQAAELGSTVPHTDYTITDAQNVVYQIRQVVVRLAGSRHHCLVDKQR